MKSASLVLIVGAIAAPTHQSPTDANHTPLNASQSTTETSTAEKIGRGSTPCEVNTSKLPTDVIEHEGTPYGVHIAGDKVLAYCDIVVGTVIEADSFVGNENAIVTKKHRQIVLDDSYLKSRLGKRGSAVLPFNPWPNNVLNYYFDDAISQAARQITYEVLTEWTRRTSIKFVETKQQPTVKMVKEDGCWSRLGYVGGEQKLSIGDGCEIFTIISHEFGHALGLIHEQQRPDRDRYVKIYYENMLQSYKNQFDILPASTSFPFDFNSIMQYSATDFGIDGKITISRADGSPLNNVVSLQVGDGQAIQEFHKLASVTLFSGANFSGDKKTYRFDENNRCVNTWADFNDIASSASWVIASNLVVNSICFYENGNCSGKFKCFPRTYNQISEKFVIEGIDDIVSSVAMLTSKPEEVCCLSDDSKTRVCGDRCAPLSLIYNYFKNACVFVDGDGNLSQGACLNEDKFQWLKTSDGKIRPKLDLTKCIKSGDKERLRVVSCGDANAITFADTAFMQGGQCWDDYRYDGSGITPVITWNCDRTNRNQVFGFSKNWMVPKDINYFSFKWNNQQFISFSNLENKKPAVLSGDAQQFGFRNGKLAFKANPALCLSYQSFANGSPLYLESCEFAKNFAFANNKVFTDGNMCVDVYRGDPSKPLNLYECIPGSANQFFTS